MKKKSILSMALTMIVTSSLIFPITKAKAETIEYSRQLVTKLERTDENWEFQVGSYKNDGKNNLYSIKKQAGNHTEIHILDMGSDYQTFLLQRILPVEATNSTVSFRIGDYNGDGNTDLYMIKKQVANHTEIHVMDGANEFQTFLLQRALPVEATDSTTDFEVGDYNGDGRDDLYMIKKQVAGKTEVHVLKAENNFADFYLQTPTILGSVGDEWEFGVSDYNNDKKADLYCINKQGSSKTELHILNGVNEYKSFLLQLNMPIDKTGVNTQFYVSKNKLVFAINKQGVTNTEIDSFMIN